MFFIHFAATTLALTATSCSAALPARGGGPGGRGRACRSRLPARTCRSRGGGASCAPAAVAAPEQSGRRFWVRMMMKKTRVPPHHHHLRTHHPTLRRLCATSSWHSGRPIYKEPNMPGMVGIALRWRLIPPPPKNEAVGRVLRILRRKSSVTRQ